MEYRGAERHALLPALRQAADQLAFAPLRDRERDDPAHLFHALFVGNAINAGEEFEILGDRRSSYRENFCDM